MNALMITVDENYADILRVFLASLRRHYPGHPEVLVCTSQWNAALDQRFREWFPFVTWLDAADLRWTGGPPMKHDQRHDHQVMYARWAVFTSRFDAYDTVLYLDADMLVLGPLDELLTSKDVVAFAESHSDKPTLVFRDRDDPALHQLLDADALRGHKWDIAANAGVVVWPRRLRTAAHLAEAERLKGRYASHLMWGDQSVLNLWMARNRLPVSHDCRFNYQVRLLLERRPCCPFREARVLHFNGQRSDTLFLMCVAFWITNMSPFGRALIPTMLRLTVSSSLHRLVGYRLGRALRRRLIARVLATATGAVGDGRGDLPQKPERNRGLRSGAALFDVIRHADRLSNDRQPRVHCS